MGKRDDRGMGGGGGGKEDEGDSKSRWTMDRLNLSNSMTSCAPRPENFSPIAESTQSLLGNLPFNRYLNLYKVEIPEQAFNALQ